MKYLIDIFHTNTDELLKSIELPPNRKKDLAHLMNWKTPEDEIYGYDLSFHQIKTLEEWTGSEIDLPNSIAQLIGIKD
ncbi:DUF7683 domain-containing protein [Pseudomonas citronellolis]|uniref:DUF7683 domain-containing protein n=1 Tax=Pseudomonas citronellolis TaxID=53408 RepID=UPI0022BA6932|nr:hypothetical protein [Pseudomonas citronellolis]WBG66412.1 hypothetical protein ELR50_27205 [Pseudomonas citronellolis]